MQNHESNLQRIQEERTAADIAAYKNLSGEQLQRWERCKSAHRFMAFDSKVVVAYKLNGQNPEVINTFTSAGLSVTLENGLESVWTDSTGKILIVRHHPIEIAPGCFMWHPKHNTLELVDWKGGKSLRFSAMWRTALNPNRKVSGEVYLSEKLAFDRNF